MAKREYVEANGYPCDPINVSAELWLYAEPRGLMVVTSPGGMRGYISWAKILRAVEDRKKAKSRKRPFKR